MIGSQDLPKDSSDLELGVRASEILQLVAGKLLSRLSTTTSSGPRDPARSMVRVMRVLWLAVGVAVAIGCGRTEVLRWTPTVTPPDGGTDAGVDGGRPFTDAGVDT